MSSRYLIGQYHPSESWGHRLDPRGKLWLAVFLMVISVFTSSALFYVCLIAGLIILLLISDISPAMIARNIRPFIILVAVTAIYHLLFSARNTDTWFTIWGFRLTEGGINLALSFSLRVLVFVGVAFFISLTTMPADLAQAMVGWLKPLRRIGVPAEDIGLIIFIAMRFIPVLAEEFDTIKKAQQVRGVDFAGGLINRARKMVYLLIPVFQSAIRRADDLAIAIEARGYVSGQARSSYMQFKWRAADIVFLVTGTMAVTALFILTRI
nr:energy-coupling factor transporter transmembrane protein EcfT [candidate division Zixibacteria bacterium]